MTMNLVTWVIQSTLLAAVAVALPPALGLRLPRARLLFWQASLVLVVLLPVLQPWHTVVVPFEAAMAKASVESGGVGSVAAADLSRFWLPAALVAGALFRLLWLALGMATLAGYRKQARPIALPAEVRQLFGRLGIAPLVALSKRVAAPVTFGWRRPTILVPARFADLDGAAQTAALGHEGLHVARRDPLAVILEEVVRAVAWFHPGVWLLLDRIALAREQVVDRCAVTLSGDRRSYLETLYQFACAGRTVLAVPFASRGHLLARIRLLTQEITMTTSRALLTTTALIAITALATLVTTATFPLMAVASAAEGTIHRVGDDVVAPKRLSGDAPVYPDDARKDRVTGRVVVRAVIDADGKVDETKVIASVDDRLSRAASDAVAGWRFTPATKAGEPVAVYYHLTINFRLDADDAEDGEGR